MDNELIVIVERLWNEYGSGKHYTVESAIHNRDGSWTISIKEFVNKKDQEAKDDN